MTQLTTDRDFTHKESTAAVHNQKFITVHQSLVCCQVQQSLVCRIAYYTHVQIHYHIPIFKRTQEIQSPIGGGICVGNRVIPQIDLLIVVEVAAGQFEVLNGIRKSLVVVHVIKGNFSVFQFRLSTAVILSQTATHTEIQCLGTRCGYP